MNKSRLFSIIFLVFLTFSAIESVFPCSMYKITVNGKTMVGNNEDSWRLTSSIWFEQGTRDKFGAVFVGYSDKSGPDGGMNEYGLVFDAFTMTHKSGMPERDPGKQDFSYQQLKTIMQHCKTVDEVYEILKNQNLHVLNGSPIFNGGMLLFVDRTGNYLVVEADRLTLGNDDKFVLANFSIADTKDPGKVKIERYRRGVEFLKNKIDTSLAFCTALSDTMSVNRAKAGDGTLYTTIYDLAEGKIHTYFFHDFERRITFDLEEELAKGDHAFHFANLFPDNTNYLKFSRYKTPQNNRSIFWFLVAAGILFFFSSIYFFKSFFTSFRKKNRSGSSFNHIKLILALLCLALSYYALVLIRNQAIFYFPSPYRDDPFSFSNMTSYLPFILLGLLPVLIFSNNKIFMTGAWGRLAKWLLTLNNAVFILLLGLFAYWKLFGIF